MSDPVIRSDDALRIRARAVELWPQVVAALHATSELTPLERDEVRNHTFTSRDQYGRELSVRLDAVTLPTGRTARVFANTTSDNHVIQLSDQLSQDQIGPQLAWAAAELMAARRRADVGVAPIRRDLLDGAVVGVEGDPARALLSERDEARLGRLDWLAQQTYSTPDRADRDALLAEIDELGLRRPESEDEAQRRARLFRTLVVGPRLSAAGRRAIRELGVPLDELPPADAVALRRHRQSRQETAVPLQAEVGSERMEPSELLARAAQAAAERDAVSRRTLAGLRAQIAAGVTPRMRLMVGGGAALAGRDAGALLVDGRGRWHVDPIPGIVQSADQVRQLRESGLGDPHAVAGPRERVPLSAVQLWEDEAAVRGPVVDGTAHLAVRPDGQLVADIQPLDGTAPVRVEVEGTPVIATGVPPEIVPGASRWVPTIPEALGAVAECLSTARSTEAAEARRIISGLPDQPGTAGTALAVLRDVPELTELRATARAAGMVGVPIEEAIGTLEATRAWDDARQQAPGRVLIGDEIGDGEYDPRAGQRWLIAGIGGGAIANAEIILAGNPDAEVVMVGTEAPWVLHNDAQYTAMRRRHDRDFAPDATGRLRTVPGRRLGPVQTAQAEDGRTVLRMLDDKGQPIAGPDGRPLEGDVYVGCLGRVARTPRVLDDLGRWADDVQGSLELSDDQQYLGYQLTYRKGDQHLAVDVTGAASRMLPADLFDAQSAALVTELGLIETPPESGNVAAGFMATALQAAHRARSTERRTARGRE